MGKDSGKLARLLALLPEQDWEQFRLYLDSPYFNRSLAVRALMECHAAAQSQGMPLPTDRELFARVHGEAPFDPVKLKNLRAALQRKLEGYLAQASLDGDVLLQQQLQVRKLGHLDAAHYLPRYHQRAVAMARDMVQDEERRQLALFHLAELLETAQLRHPDRSQDEVHASTAYHHAWQFFQLRTLKHLVKLANAGAMVGQDVDTQQAEAILALIPAEPVALPTVQLYRDMLDVFRNPHARQHFDRLHGRLQALAPALAPEDALDIYTGAINHCIRRINLGETAFLPTLLALYQEMDRNDLLLVRGRLPAAQFKNMVALALRCQDQEWAGSLIQRYSDHLDQDPHGTARAFTLGMLHFSQGDYDAAERAFHQVLDQFEDIFYGLDARSFLLRIYYETGNAVGMESLAESFKMYVKRNKRIAKAHKDSYLTTARLFKKLIQLQPWDRSALLQLRAEITAAAFASSSKQWLLGKVAELLGEVP